MNQPKGPQEKKKNRAKKKRRVERAGDRPGSGGWARAVAPRHARMKKSAQSKIIGQTKRNAETITA